MRFSTTQGSFSIDWIFTDKRGILSNSKSTKLFSVSLRKREYRLDFEVMLQSATTAKHAGTFWNHPLATYWLLWSWLSISHLLRTSILTSRYDSVQSSSDFIKRHRAMLVLKYKRTVFAGAFATDVSWWNRWNSERTFTCRSHELDSPRFKVSLNKDTLKRYDLHFYRSPLSPGILR